MNRWFPLALVVFLLPRTAPAQIETIGVYSDAGATTHTLDDQSSEQVELYVIHTSAGATSSRFMLVGSGGFACTYVGENSTFSTIGSAETGLAVYYDGACLFSNILVVTVSYFCTGASATCARLTVVPDPAASSGNIEVVDCSYQVQTALGLEMCVNPDGSCCADPVETSTWGQIKSLYR
jgi:hypothetical protein